MPIILKHETVVSVYYVESGNLDQLGKNLNVLGQIEGVDLEMYKESVLPRVVNCKDELAQYHLMEYIIQVFPDEYHLQTLETLLAACTQLMGPTVDTKIVLTQLMDRLSNYAASNPDVLHEFLQVEAFSKFSNAIGKGACVVKLSSVPNREDPRAMKQVVALLSAPLEKYNDIVTALTLSDYSRLMDHLDHGTNEVMAMLINQSKMKKDHCTLTADMAESDCNLEPVAYEFFTQAFILYEEMIADSKAQVTAIHLIKATRYSANILEKPDQCRAIYACSHLFWVYDIYGIRDGERVLLFLKRALRIAIEAQEMAKATRGLRKALRGVLIMSRRQVGSTRRRGDSGSFPFVGALHSKSHSSPLLSIFLVLVGACLLIGYAFSGPSLFYLVSIEDDCL
ncbi:hypothetical protein Bca101_057068 [Brassica carinata]